MIQTQRCLNFLIQHIFLILAHKMSPKKVPPESLDEGDLFNEDISEVLTVMGGDGEFIIEELILEFELTELLVDGGVLLLENVDGLFLLLDEKGQVLHSFALLDETLEADSLGVLEGGEVGDWGGNGVVEHV